MTSTTASDLFPAHSITGATRRQALDEPKPLYFTREEHGILRDFFKSHPTVYKVSRTVGNDWIVEIRKTYPGETVATSFFGKSFWIETAYAEAVASQVAYELAQ